MFVDDSLSAFRFNDLVALGCDSLVEWTDFNPEAARTTMRTDAGGSIDRIVARGGDARGVLRVAAGVRGVTMAELSRAIDRGAGYVGRFVERGVPAALVDADLRDLARCLGIDASLLA